MLISLFRKKNQTYKHNLQPYGIAHSVLCFYASFSAQYCTDGMKLMNTQTSQIKGKHLGISFLHNEILSNFLEEKLWFLVTSDFCTRLTKKGSWIPFHSIMFTLCTTLLTRFCQIKPHCGVWHPLFSKHCSCMDCVFLDNKFYVFR